jgi:hypothetical protein
MKSNAELTAALRVLLELLHVTPGTRQVWLAPGVLYAEIAVDRTEPQPEFLVLAFSPTGRGSMTREDVRELVHRLGGGLRAH